MGLASDSRVLSLSRGVSEIGGEVWRWRWGCVWVERRPFWLRETGRSFTYCCKTPGPVVAATCNRCCRVCCTCCYAVLGVVCVPREDLDRDSKQEILRHHCRVLNPNPRTFANTSHRPTHPSVSINYKLLCAVLKPTLKSPPQHPTLTDKKRSTTPDGTP